MDAVMTTSWWLALCVDCAGPLPQPFSDPDERNDWATGHSDGTGHRVLIQKTTVDTAVNITGFTITEKDES